MHFIFTCGNAFLLTVKMNLFNHFINYCIVRYYSVVNRLIDRNYESQSTQKLEQVYWHWGDLQLTGKGRGSYFGLQRKQELKEMETNKNIQFR